MSGVFLPLMDRQTFVRLIQESDLYHRFNGVSRLTPPPDHRLNLLGGVAGQTSALRMEPTAVGPQTDRKLCCSSPQQANQPAGLWVVKVIEVHVY